MPGHWGRSSSGSRSLGPAGGASAGGNYGGNRNPQQTYGRRSTPVTTGGAGLPPQLGGLSTKKQAQQFTGTGAGLPPQLGGSSSAAQAAKFTKKTTPVTTGGGITKSDIFRKFISKYDPRHTRFDPRYWSDETGGNLLQLVANMPKYWKLPSGLRSLIESGAEIPFAHGTKTLDDYYDLSRTGFQAARTKYIPTAYDWFKGTNPFKAEGVFGAVGTKAEDALRAAKEYAKGAVLRGSDLGKTTGKVFEGMIDPAKAYINRGLTGVIQARVPSDIANKAFNLPEWLSGKPGVKAFTEPGLHKIGSRLLPGANIALGGASALGHFKEGNIGQGLMAGLSMVPGPLGYVGLAGELGLGALQKYGDQIPDWQATQAVGRNYNRGGIARLHG